MKVTILQENLLAGLGGVMRFTSSRTQLPVLSQVLMSASGKDIFIQATDLEKGMRVKVAGKVEEEGEVALPAKTLHELLVNSEPGAVTFTEEGSEVEFAAKRMTARLQTMDAAEFPKIQSESTGGVLVGSFSLETWREGWERVGFALSKDEARPVLTGIYWVVDELLWVATDGFRLSMTHQIQSQQTGKLGGIYLMGGSMVAEMVKQLGDQGVDQFDVYLFSESQELLIQAGHISITGRLIEGDYPNYQSIVPKTFGRSVRVMREDLTRAIKAAAVFAQDSARIIRLVFDEGGLTITANTPQVGKNEVKVELVESFEGDFEIAFNARYLIDLTSHLAEPEVTIGMNEPLSPACFWGKKKRNFQHVIMPVRVRD